VNFWRLLFARQDTGRGRVLLAVCLSAIATGAVIVAAAERLAGGPDWVLPGELAGALLAITGAGYGTIWASNRIAGWMGGLSRQIRHALMTRYAALEPAALAGIDVDAVRDGAVAFPRGLGRLGIQAPDAVHSWLAAMACVLVTLAIDPVSGAALLVAMKLGGVITVARIAGGQRANGASADADNRLVRALDATFHGMKPLLLIVPRPGQIRETELERAIAEHRRLDARRFAWGAALAGLAGAGRLVLAALLVAVAHLSGASAHESIAMVSIAFLIPFDWIDAIPLVTSLSAAADRLAHLDSALLDADRRWPPPLPAHEGPFGSLELAGAIFRHPAHPGAPGAIVGPVSCRVAPGKILFVTGGFGAGKSSVLHMLAGVATPEGGSVLRDGVLTDVRRSRGMAALVSADPVLFAGTPIPNAGRGDVRALIQVLDLEDTDSVAAGRIVHPEAIAAGVRARLALLIAVAGDAPLLLLDEWDTWQQPAMRALVNNKVLPSLRNSGRAIVVATQDDRYIGMTDDVVRLESGRAV
jgi:putative ATP-binding cassette transporter